MDDETTTADLLNAWRDAVQAADLAERLATTAAKAADDADRRSVASADLAELAEQAAASATRAAARATAAAADAADLAKALREEAVTDAQRTVETAKANELEARTALGEAQAKPHRETA